MKAVRPFIQSLFLALTLLAGWQFLLFYQFLENPSLPPVERPPVVEGFLPISATLAFRHWIGNGIFDSFHPAGLVLLLLIFGSAFLAGRIFCGWVCPVGTVSEYWGMFGSWLLRKIGRSQIEPGTISRKALAATKYFLLSFFIYICWFALNLEQIAEFLSSPYNQVADLKMLLLFLEPGMATVLTVVLLVLLGTLIRNFWCRILCPYGASLGIAGLAAPIKVGCKQQFCDRCGTCESACGNFLKPHQNAVIRNPGCTLCMSCCHACPTGAMQVRIGYRKPYFLKGRRAAYLGVGIAFLFLVLIGIAKILGYWESHLGVEDFKRWLPEIRSLKHY